MKHYYPHNAPDLAHAHLLRVERNKLNPLPGPTFVSIAYYQIDGEEIAIVF